MSEKTIRILIVDDHYVVRMGVMGILRSQPRLVVVGEAEDGLKAIELFRKHLPDIVLMDLRMPAMSGVEATSAICKEFPNAKIIVLTTFDKEEDIFRALEAGAKGYLSKRVLGKGLIDAIQIVYGGERYIPKEVSRILAARAPDSSLTDQQMQVLRFIAKGMTNKEICKLMGFTIFTAKFHVQNVLKKLGVCDRTEAATAAIERGILSEED